MRVEAPRAVCYHPRVMAEPQKKVIARNKQAKRNFAIEDEFEAGLVLMGSEVKSLRAGKASLDEAYVRLDGGKYGDGQLYLVGCHIAEYKFAHRTGHEPRRDRKLLLHRREIDRLAQKVTEKGFTMVPMELYFKGARVKLLFGLGKGKKLHDKRHDLAARDAKREMARALKNTR